MHEEYSLEEIKRHWHGSLRSYVIGLLFSILLTAASFLLAANRRFAGHGVAFMIIGLAILQAIVQTLFFLHVGRESKPRWETIIFSFMVMVVVIIVIGTLWIMYDLNTRVMAEMGGP